MLTLPQIPEWFADALCAQVGGDNWFPEKSHTPKHAKRICASCPVKTDCLAYALTDPALDGVWGGKTYRERVAIRLGKEEA